MKEFPWRMKSLWRNSMKEHSGGFFSVMPWKISVRIFRIIFEEASVVNSCANAWRNLWRKMLDEFLKMSSEAFSAEEFPKEMPGIIPEGDVRRNSVGITKRVCGGIFITVLEEFLKVFEESLKQSVEESWDLLKKKIRKIAGFTARIFQGFF